MEMSFSMIRARIADAEDPRDRRRYSRLPIELDAHMRELGASGVEARIVNISERDRHARKAPPIARVLRIGDTRPNHRKTHLHCQFTRSAGRS